MLFFEFEEVQFSRGHALQFFGGVTSEVDTDQMLHFGIFGLDLHCLFRVVCPNAWGK